MTAIANAVIEQVWEGKSGVSTYGPWTAYNFKVEGHEEKFGYFGGEGKPVPRVGMVLEVLQYTTTEKDGYTNHTVKKLQTGVSTTQPVKTPQGASQAPKTAIVRKDVKGIKIGFYACLKTAGSLGMNTVEELIKQAKIIFIAAEEFSLTYRPDLPAIQAKMVSAGIPDDFWRWLVEVNKVGDKNDLTPVATQYTIENFSAVVDRYVQSTLPEEPHEVEQEEPPDFGPADTSYPEEIAPEPGEAVVPF